MDLKSLKNILVLGLRFAKNPTRKDFGFTLVELLIVIIIIGILAAISLPSFLSQSNKARFAEAKAYVGTMSRLQQAYYLEKRVFADNINKLGLGVNTTTGSFTYSVLTGDINGSTATAQIDSIITNVATPTSYASVQPFIGVVGVPGIVNIDAIFCIGNTTSTAIAPGALNAGLQILLCPTNFTQQFQ